MFWRKFKLDWTYALGELFIVVVGVLIALAINVWNEERLERAQERDFIRRLISDIGEDQRRFDFQLKAIDRKEASLLRLRTTFAGDGPIDAAGFLRDIVTGANFGWSQMSTERVTFDDLLESGRLGLIEDADIRALIATYYESSEQALIRIDERETQYPSLSYQLVPRGPASTSGSSVGEGTLDPDLSNDDTIKLVKVVQESALRDHLISEINLARFIRGVSQSLKTRGGELINRLEKYQEKIG